MNSKKISGILSLLIGILFTTIIQAQDKTNVIIGKWESEKKDAKMEIFKDGDEYKAKLLWGNKIVNADGSSKKDINNKDEKLQNRNLIGIVYIKGLKFNDGEWNQGEVYNNENGKWYNCYIWLKKGKLHLRGYLGMKMFGQTTKWNRIK